MEERSTFNTILKNKIKDERKDSDWEVINETAYINTFTDSGV